MCPRDGLKDPGGSEDADVTIGDVSSELHVNARISGHVAFWEKNIRPRS